MDDHFDSTLQIRRESAKREPTHRRQTLGQSDNRFSDRDGVDGYVIESYHRNRLFPRAGQGA